MQWEVLSKAGKPTRNKSIQVKNKSRGGQTGFPLFIGFSTYLLCFQHYFNKKIFLLRILQCHYALLNAMCLGAYDG